VKGVIVTTRGNARTGIVGSDDINNDYHFESRYFAPWVGIPEDPVTGSAHTVLAPLWTSLLGKTWPSGERIVMRALQCSPRGGDMSIHVQQQEQKQEQDGSCVVVEAYSTVVLRGCIALP
jgi:predicted PhzF superfamily epimerase YddE/YHI9